MNIDFEKIRLDALANITDKLEDNGMDKVAKVLLDAASRVSASMLKAYHEQMIQDDGKNHSQTDP